LIKKLPKNICLKNPLTRYNYKTFCEEYMKVNFFLWPV
jgi:hypothetical protein